MSTITVAGRDIELDVRGFLVNHSDWNEAIAKAMARADSFRVSKKHWEIIHFVRQHYGEHQTAASRCALARAVDESLGRGSVWDSVWQVSPWWIKYAGLPDLPYRVIVMSGKRVELDEEGFLINRSDWNEEIAKEIAKADEVELTPEHWEIINFMRAYYDEYQISPSARALFTRRLARSLGQRRGMLNICMNFFQKDLQSRQISLQVFRV